MFTDLIKYIKQSKFAYQFTTFSLGILFSQLIFFAAMPILTRLYPPEVFASYALFISLSGIMVHTFTGNYDLALVVIKKETDVNFLLTLIFCISLIFLLIFSIVFYFFDDFLKKTFNAGDLDYLWYLIPLGTFFFSIFSTLKYFFNRFEDYKKINFIFISRSSLFVFFSLSLIIFDPKNGLVIAELLGLFLVFFFYLLNFTKYFNFKFKKLFLIAISYKDFFLKNSFVNSLDSLTMSLPIIFITIYYEPKYVAFFALCSRIVFTPLVFISKSLSHIHLKKVTDLVNNNEDAISYLFKISFLLSIFTLFPITILFFFSDIIFQIVFGDIWSEAGQMMSILIFSFGLQFVVSTLSQVFAPTGNLTLSFFWKIFSFILTFILFYFFPKKIDIYLLIEYFVYLNLFLYIVYYLLILYSVKYPKVKY